jgi:tetratricopeptide (TPR) repeat protein
MAEMLLYALHFINAMKFGTAKRILSIIDRRFSNEITAHLYGFAEMLAGRTGRARARFHEALRHNGEFWPARFYLATVLKDAGDYKHALREFQACRDGISGTGGEANLRYRFLMENFSERYFLELCTHWIETLKNK